MLERARESVAGVALDRQSGGTDVDVDVDVLNERRGRDDGVVLERERRERHATARQPEQIEELRPCAREPRLIRRPAELRQERLRVEDAAARALGPVAFDQADQTQLVDVGVGGGARVEQEHARRARPRRERLPFDPAPDAVRELGARQRAVVERRVGVAQHFERGEDGCPRAEMPIVDKSETLVRADEREDHLDLRRCSRRVGGGLEVRGNRRRQGQGPLESRQAAGRRRGRVRRGHGRELREPACAPEILLRDQRSVEPCDIGGRTWTPVAFEHDMRRRQELDDRRPCELAGEACKDHVHRGGKRFAGERQRVGRLIRDAAVGKDLAREIQVRQRTLEHDRRPVQSRGPPRIGFHASNDVRQLLFAVSTDEGAPRPRLAGTGVGDRQNRRRRRGGLALFFDARQQRVDALMETGGQHRLGCDDVQTLECGQPRQQVKVRGPQPSPIRRLIGDCHHDLPICGRGCGQETRAERVLVEPAA